MKELFVNLAFLGGGAVFAVLLNWMTGSLWVAMVPPPVCAGIGFFAVFKDPRQGRSGLELFRDNRRYRAKQRRYLFVFGTGRD